MATFTATVTYPDNKAAELRDTLANVFGYQSTIDDGQGGTIPNPQTKAQFVQKKVNGYLQEWIKNTYQAEKHRVAIAAAETINVTI